MRRRSNWFRLGEKGLMQEACRNSVRKGEEMRSTKQKTGVASV
jgi:hypothetical protein